MRIFSKALISALALGIPMALAACSSDDSSDNSNNSGGNGNSTGGSNSGSGGSSATGGNGMGGEPNVEVPVDCEFESDGLFCIDDCLASAGPGDRVKNATVGAFTADKTWMDGWTNWSTNSSGVANGEPDEWIEADITADKTLTADKVWGLKGKIHVTDGVTLTIEPGTVIKGHSSTVGTLVISRGGKIDAVGTAAKPIIFTSAFNDGEKGKAQWGGVIILGKSSNWSGVDAQIEGLADDALNKHGCGAACVEDDNSGTLKYVRIEFGGNEIGSGNEINGLTLGSVGSGTTISHVQVNTTLDDGIEIFGGSVNVDHFVVNNAGDDMYDFDQGYHGTIDTVFGRQIVPSTEDPNGFEWDSDKSADKTPHTEVTFKNGTMCGTGELGMPNYGMVLRENVRGSIDNLAFMGFDFGIDTRESRFEDDGTTPKMTFTNSASWYHIDGVSDASEDDDDSGFDEAKWFQDGTGNVDLDK